ncbi:hypothetical protein ACIOD2_25675 [Amycolatopsis sp. NPDC088138]|uniref:hypothetical protein n=1 Tax=Amycolatopsis sp. NPDC088138 TaxID=3363938 RepID=UPI00381EBEC2
MEIDAAGNPAIKGPAAVPKPARLAHLRIDPRGYPIIATVGQGSDEVDFGSLSEKRKLVLATFDLCAVCALPFGDEPRWQVSFHEDRLKLRTWVSNEAPVHEVCGLYAAQVCPFVSSPYARLGDEFRKGQRRPDVVVLAGFKQTKRVFGRRSGLQGSEFVLHFETTDLVRSHSLHDGTEARQAYEELLQNDPPVPPDVEERELADLICNLTAEENEDSGGVMAGAAWFAGAAFCPGVRNVQGMERYAKNAFYTQIAQRVLTEPGFAQEFMGSDDPSTRAAMKWLTTRSSLPDTLKSWRSSALNRLGREHEPASGSGKTSDQRKTKRKAQTATRRKNRR